jgi:hypothetical protein
MLSGKGKSVCGIFSAMFAGGAISLQEQVALNSIKQIIVSWLQSWEKTSRQILS